MSRKTVMMVTIGSFVATSLTTPVMAYQATSLPADTPQTRPAPLPAPVPQTRPTTRPAPVPPTTRPVPLPKPVRPTNPVPPPTTKPTPLPGYPGGPAVQPPRPVYPGGPEIQPPRPVYPGRPEIQPPRPTYPGDGYGDGYAGTIRCESRNDKTRRCSARTENRVRLVRQLSDTNCREGRSWYYDRNSITVTRGCRGEFAYGYGNNDGYPYPDRDDNKGPSTGAIIAGVAVAGGLIALLASSGKKKKKAETETSQPTTPDQPTTYPPGPPASLTADLSALPANARPVAQSCLFEASRQIGATGGTRLRYDRLVSLEPGNGGWRIRASLTGTYPDGERPMTMYCRATPTKIVELTFS